MKDFLSNTFFQAYRWQSKNRLLRLQDKQFSDRPAKMQWWYYDFFTGDGVIGVLAFIPFKWWPDTSDLHTGRSLLMFCLRRQDGEIRRYQRSVDSASFKRTSTGLSIGEFLTLEIRVENGKTCHSLTFDLGNIHGSLEISPTASPFSAIPLGSLSAIERKVVYRMPWSRSPFRYVSQIPRGDVSGTISMENAKIEIQGYVYHEQGWFDNDPHLLNQGWYWYHFLHERCNIFGLPGGYIYVQLDDQTVLGGMCLCTKNYRMEPQKFDNTVSSKILTGGRINLEANNLEIEIYLDSTTNQDLIEFDSINSDQLWNTSVVESACSVDFQGKTQHFTGNAMVETCWLQS